MAKSSLRENLKQGKNPPKTFYIPNSAGFFSDDGSMLPYTKCGNKT
jgi:hypothetical protein